MNNTDLDKIASEVKKVVDQLPQQLGNEIVNFALDNFRLQGWRGSSLQPWQKRSPKAKKNNGRAILINTGRLRRSIKVLRVGAGFVTVGSDVPYAKAHNEGFKGVVTVKAFTRNKYAKAKASNVKTHRNKTITYKAGSIEVKSFKRNMNLPKRQFLPNDANDSPILKKQLTDFVYNQIKKVYK
jgi:phage gpG-like protein